MKVSFDVRTTVLGVIDTLINVHRAFLEKLKAAYDAYPQHNVATVFLEALPSFDVYIQYVRTFSMGLDELVQEKKSSQVFANFVMVRLVGVLSRAA